MGSIRSLLLVVAAALTLAAAEGTSPTPLTTPTPAADPVAPLRVAEAVHVDIFKRFAPAVVGLNCDGPGTGPNGQHMGFYGTGAVVSADGLILTDTTVVPVGATGIKVYFTDGRVRPATIVEGAAACEAMVLKVDAKELTCMHLADSADYQVGDPAYSWGNPYLTIQTDGAVCLATGSISGIYAASSVDSQSRYLGPVIETDAAVNPGSDGGPLTDGDGNLIGIMSLGFSRTRWLGLAIPSHELIAALPSLKALPRTKRLAPTGPRIEAWADRRAFAEAAAKVEKAVVTVVVGGDEAKLAPRRADERLVAVDPIPPQLVASFESTRPTPCIATGFLVDATGTIVTAGFNLGDRTASVCCYLADGARVPAKLLGADDWHDLAVLKIEPRPGLVPAILGDGSKLASGRSIAVLGRSESPGGLCINAGTVSAIKRYDNTCCQISALIDDGNLGGPVIDLQGRVLGMTNHLGEKTPWRQNCGVGFMLQAEVIKQVWPDLAAGKTIERPERPFLGVRGDIGAMDVKGARVTGVTANGPAATAGIKENDVIVAYNAKPIGDWIGLSRAIRESKIGSKATVRLMREKKPMSVTVTVGRME